MTPFGYTNIGNLLVTQNSFITILQMFIFEHEKSSSLLNIVCSTFL